MPTAAHVHIRADVATAVRAGQPVVALESTLIAHGLPRPDNLDLAHELEAIVRAEGAVPATIGVAGGVATVGLDAAQLERLATAPGVAKLSVRDLPVAMAAGIDGATTVAGTSFLAARAGIRLFATGGLGGVHRDARETWDESADLATLSRTPIAVVCAGVKSILDTGATMERLESLNVTVVGFRTRRFPGFYLADAGYPLDWSVDSEDQVAQIILAQDELSADKSLYSADLAPAVRRLPLSAAKGLPPALERSEGSAVDFHPQTGPGALVVANPIPVAEQLDRALHDRVLAEGLAEAARQGVRGKAVTPFLLAHFHDATGGESLRVNKQIVRYNARLAARIACAYARQT